MKKIVTSLLLLTIAFVQLSSGVVVAQETDAKKDSEKSTKKLTPKGELLLARYKALRTHLSKIAVMLKKKDPKTAALIEKALKESAELDIEKGMQNVIKALRQGDTDEASAEQKAVVKALQEFYDLIKEGNKKDQESPLDRERKILEESVKKIDELIKENKADERKNNAIVNKEEIQKNIGQLIKNLQTAINQQEKINKQTKVIAAEIPAELKMLNDLYKKLEKHRNMQVVLNKITKESALSELPLVGSVQEKYGNAINEISKLVKGIFAKDQVKKLLKDAGVDEIQSELIIEKCVSAGEQSLLAKKFLLRSDKQKTAPYQKQVVGDITKAMQLLSDIIKKIAASTPAGKLANSQKQLSQKTNKLSTSMKKLAERANVDLDKLAKKSNPKESKAGKKGLDKTSAQMNKSSENLQNGKPKEAQKNQDSALELMKKQLALVKKLKAEAGKNANKKIDPKNLERIAKKADKIAESLKNKKLGTLPGQQSMKQAAKKSSKASKNMSQNQPSKQQQGSQQQQQATKDMQDAKDKMEDRIAQIKRQQKKKKLRGIRDRLAKILQLQESYSEKTKDTYELRLAKSEDKYEREEEQLLNLLSSNEAKLAENIQEILNMLANERRKSSMVFPDVLADIQEDLKAISQKLLDKQAGSYTQLVQAEVEITIKQLIDSIEKELARLSGFKKRKKKKNENNDGNNGGNKPQPLLPKLADLKMLRNKQLRINRIAKRLRILAEQNKIDNKTLEEESKKLSEREKKIREFIDKMNPKKSTPPKNEMAV